jgi:hypothetical protein
MTIALHWWMLPALLLLLALWQWWKAEHADGGCFSGLGEIFAAIALAAMALAVCAGHFL